MSVIFIPPDYNWGGLLLEVVQCKGELDGSRATNQMGKKCVMQLFFENICFWAATIVYRCLLVFIGVY